MSNMISVASGFQYSVNIGYDLNNDDKLKNFIPTKAALELLEEILLSTNPNSTERARVLIGAYGKGKSHIILTILSLLMKKDLSLFEKTLPRIKDNEKLYQYLQYYYEGEDKIFPVVISGSNTSLPQAFLMALQRSLAENELLDVMPETNYKAAIAVINRWQHEFPDTYAKFEQAIDKPAKLFIEELADYSITAYEKFEKIYPTLTAGSIFNPFLGFDVVELYENAIKGLRKKGYSGIYVVYDEFSKFLEANISEASVSDTKMLQDFAEKCNRSGENQLHLLLISHKEISNYIDKLPKQKVDGWRGVSERFSHIHLNNNFTQTYEIIASVIQKNDLWHSFCTLHKNNFENIEQRYLTHTIFADTTSADLKKTFVDCYPLHPVSTFILPRLSERVAQNERTLFTFLSANGASTLPAFLSNYEDDRFEVITPDCIYDYFEPLFKKEVYSGELYKTYLLTNMILAKLQEGSLESKLVKTLALIYILEQFEKLKPTQDELVGIYSISHSVAEIEQAITSLVEKEYVVYLKRSNNYLRLKQTSGVDIRQKITDMIASQANRTSVKEVLNQANFDNYIYPSRYNDDREMTRYFSFEFIAEDEVSTNTNWNMKAESSDADGMIYAIIPSSQETIAATKDTLLESSNGFDRHIFVLPKKYVDIQEVVKEYNAVATLRDLASGDKVLFEEYDVIYEDLREVIHTFINSYTKPEQFKSVYIFNGVEQNISRKAALTALMSDICDTVFSHTPVINNEAINRNEITSIANNSRTKVITALLRNELESNLGLTGSGQEVSMMRSTLYRTKVLVDRDGLTEIDLHPEDQLIKNMLQTIVAFIMKAKEHDKVCFDELYDALMLPKNHIGLRKGLIPIYIAAVFHEYKQEIVIMDRFGQTALNADTLLQINANPKGYFVSYLEWNPEKETFVNELESLFKGYIIAPEKTANSYDYIVSAMKRWYLSLPKYSKESKHSADGNRVDRQHLEMLRLFKQNIGTHELLFEKIPAIFGYTNQINPEVAENINVTKNFYDAYLDQLKNALISITKELFSSKANSDLESRVSLSSVIKDWCESLDDKIFEQLFTDGTEKCLTLFKSVTNDEDDFIAKLAKLTTDLRLEDWDDSTILKFKAALEKHKKTAEEFHGSDQIQEATETNMYQVMFVDESGTAVTKRFDKVEYSKRGKLLYNAITADLDSMGQSISEQEKRQILMDVLKKLC